MKFFELKEEHLKLMKHMWVGWQDCEYGAPEIDPKRPYGNSDVELDIVEILWPDELPDHDDEDWWYEEGSMDLRNRARVIHEEMQTALQVVLSAQTFKLGKYQADNYSQNWILA